MEITLKVRDANGQIIAQFSVDEWLDSNSALDKAYMLVGLARVVKQNGQCYVTAE